MHFTKLAHFGEILPHWQEFIYAWLGPVVN
jgi:hypothetical protein